MTDLHSTLQMFGVAALGSFLNDVLTLSEDRGARELPQRYKDPFFWLVRLFVAVLAGGLALALDVRTSMQAFFVGVSAPLLIQRMAAGTVSLKREEKKPRIIN